MSFYTGKTILVTGATGLIGSNLVHKLMTENDIRVIVLARSENKIKEVFDKYLSNSNFDYIVQDISAPLNIDKKIDLIFHAAGPISGDIIKNNPVDVIMPNIIGTKNCLDFLKNQEEQIGLKGRIVLFSSATVYGNLSDKNITVKEEDTQISDSLDSPISAYSQTKRMTETMGRAYAKQYGIDVVIARFSYVYGYCKYYPNTALYSFMEKALNGEDITLNGINFGKRDNIYVEDAVDYLLKICEKGETANAYNISSNGANGNFAAIDEIAEVVAEVANKKFNKNIKVIKKKFEESSRAVGILMDNLKTLAVTSFDPCGGGGVTSLSDGISWTMTLIYQEKKGGAVKMNP